MQWGVIAALGFCIYGPQMLIGLCGAELISPKSVGASQGILGLISYMGAAGAGIPLSYLQVGTPAVLWRFFICKLSASV
jgi:sugar phosphate permease